LCCKEIKSVLKARLRRIAGARLGPVVLDSIQGENRIMGGSAMKLKSGDQVTKPPSETGLWCCVFVFVAAQVVVSTILGVRAGEYAREDVFVLAPGKVGVALGLFLGWGLFHTVSRHHADVWLINSFWGIVHAMRRMPGVLENFAIAFLFVLATGMVTLAVSIPLLRALGYPLERSQPWASAGRGRSLLFRVLPYLSKESSSSLSGHLLYDAAIDGATAPEPRIQKPGRA
jgi:hypothetical protein